MKAFFTLGLAAFVLPLLGAVCQADSPDAAPSSAQQTSPTVQADNQSDEEAEIAARLAKLGQEDRRLATAQKFCPIMGDNRLGSMGVPTKIKDKPVFLCCKGCRRKAIANPDATLAKVEELKAKNGG